MVAVGLLGRARGHALILTWATRGWSGFSRWDLLEGAALLTALVLLAELPSQRDVPYVVFPVLIWAALRFGPRGAATALVVVSGLTVWNTAHNAGPFVRESITDSLLSSQLFLATAALTGLVLAAVTAERTRADEALRANEERLRSVVQSMAEGLIVRDARRDHHRLQCGRGADPRRGPRAIARTPARGRPRRRGGRARIQVVPQAGSWVTRRSSSGGPASPRSRRELTRPDGTPAWVLDQLGARPGRRRPTRGRGLHDERRHPSRAKPSSASWPASSRPAPWRTSRLLCGASPRSSPARPRRARSSSASARRSAPARRPGASVLRFESDEHATVVGSWRDAGMAGMPLGSRSPRRRLSRPRVRRSGGPERIDDYADAPGRSPSSCARSASGPRSPLRSSSPAGCGACWSPR